MKKFAHQGAWISLLSMNQVQLSDMEKYHGQWPSFLAHAVEKRRRHFLAGRLCSRALWERLGETVEFPLERLEDGRPHAPEKYLHSISHCESYACAIVGAKTEFKWVGLDVEDLMAKETIQSVEKNIWIPKEKEKVLQQLTIDRGLTLVFSAKESVFKSGICHKGPSKGFLDFEIMSISSETISLNIPSSKTPVSVDYQWIDERTVMTVFLGQTPR